MHPIAASVQRISGLLRQLIAGDEEEQKGGNENDTLPLGRGAVQQLVELVHRLIRHIPLHSTDRLRTPYHFVLCASRQV